MCKNVEQEELPLADNKKRQTGLDLLKCICAFLVVCIHVPFNFKGGEYFLLLTRIAVPSFFMISGFFYDFIVQHKKEFHQIKKVFILVVSTGILYFIWNIIRHLINGNSISHFLKSTFTIDNLFRYLFFNRAIVGGHLWYLAALLYTLIIVALFRKLGALKLLYILSPLLIAADIIFGTYANVIFGRTFWYFYFRNYLFVGIPYFILGHLINIYRERIKAFFGSRSPIPFLCISSVVFCGVSFVEYYLLNKARLDGSRENYIGTVFFTLSVFLIFAVFYNNTGSRAESFFSYIGQIQSSSIYIYHPIVIKLCALLFTHIGLFSIYSAVAPIIVFAVTSTAIFIVSLISHKTIIKP